LIFYFAAQLQEFLDPVGALPSGAQARRPCPANRPAQRRQ